MDKALNVPIKHAIDGTEYNFTRLTEFQVVELHSWAKARLKASGLANLTDQQERFNWILTVERLPRDDAAIMGQITSPAAVPYVLWLSLKKNHPEITLEAVEGMLSDNLELAAYVGELMPDVDTDDGNPKAPSTTPEP